MKDENLCQAVGCLSMHDHVCKCIVNVDGKNVKATVRFCHDHFLRQKAVEYHKEKSK